MFKNIYRTVKRYIKNIDVYFKTEVLTLKR